MVSTWARRRLRTAHLSTLLAVLGVALIALGIVLTLAGVVGDVVPTVLALLGGLSLVARPRLLRGAAGRRPPSGWCPAGAPRP